MSQLFDLLKYFRLLVLIWRLCQLWLCRDMSAGAASEDVAKLPCSDLRACVADCLVRMALAPTVRVQFIAAVCASLINRLSSYLLSQNVRKVKTSLALA